MARRHDEGDFDDDDESVEECRVTCHIAFETESQREQCSSNVVVNNNIMVLGVMMHESHVKK